MTRGLEVIVLWKEESTDFIQLKDIKNSKPFEVAEYVVANLIPEDPAFSWWVSMALRRQNKIISKFKSKYWRKTHKFGIRLTKTVEEALIIDKEVGNYY